MTVWRAGGDNLLHAVRCVQGEALSGPSAPTIASHGVAGCLAHNKCLIDIN